MTDKLSLAQRYAWDLAKTLMTSVTLFRWECGYGVMPTAEFDGPAESIITEYDPFSR